MDVKQVLRMNGGIGDDSYATNSLVQRKVISLIKPIREAAMVELYNSMLSKISTVCIADLGCGSGPNALVASAELVKFFEELSRKCGIKPPKVQILLNDLPGNDFSSIFQFLLPQFQEEVEQGFGSCSISASPGSFYERLFPEKSIHFVHSSYSIMWLSQVPKGIDMNKENIYITRASPKSVVNAYYKQFKIDFSSFLNCRSEEVVTGGKMVLTILGRKGKDPSSKEGSYIWELLAKALQEMVYEGLIEEEMLHSFHIPQYTPSPAEVKAEVHKEGSFTINHLEATEITWADCGSGFGLLDDGYNVAKCMRSVAEPLLIQHFGELVIDTLFDKYKSILSDRMSKEETKFINVTVSMTRR